MIFSENRRPLRARALLPRLRGTRTRQPSDSCRNASVPAIYKICDASQWRAAEVAGTFRGAAVDEHDGFIHLSTAAQVGETAARHFAGAADLTLVAVDADALGAALKWEPSRGGDLFPHLYAALPMSAVIWARPLPLGPGGRHVFPELVP